MLTREISTVKPFTRGRLALVRVLILAANSEAMDELRSRLEKRGYSCIIADESEAAGLISEQVPEIILLETDSFLLPESSKPVPVIGLLTRDKLNGSLYPGLGDFIIEPYSAEELALRMNRLLQRGGNTGEQIKAGGLLIDIARCEVSVDGRAVMLTFKEYELLKFLAANPGRVFSREALLDKVWGYDYFGGDRTVDVHVRRLRSKIEDPGYSFIETVRNIGYRFRKDCGS